MSFDPRLLHGLSLSLDDDDDVVNIEDGELGEIDDPLLRQACASLKLASRIVGFAVVESKALDDDGVLKSIERTMDRLASLRRHALEFVGVSKESSDYPAVFNVVTNAMLDILTEEWKWGQGHRWREQLSPAVLGTLFKGCLGYRPERFDWEFSATELVLVRRLAVLEAIPKVYGLLNHFDYFRDDRDAFAQKLLNVLVEEAEVCARNIDDEVMFSDPKRMVLRRSYGIATGILCETYKMCAYQDVMALEELPALDRSIRIGHYEHLGGMDYDHVIESFRRAMKWVVEVANMIQGSQDGQ